jgi:UDP-glucose 4-epimerase
MGRKAMKSLVTGGAGFIGSHMVERLLSEGHEVVCVDNMSAESNERFHWNKMAKNHDLDIRGLRAHMLEGVDYVFHMAAESRIMQTMNNPVRAAETNLVGTATVLQCARSAGCKRFVYSSTSSVYGRNMSPNEESQIPDCLNPYSASKYAGELFCKNYNDLFGLDTVVLRYFNVYGDRAPEKGHYAPVTAIFARQKRQGLPLTVVGDGLQRRDFVNVSDVVDANLKAATANIPSNLLGTAFNVGTGKNWSILEVASWMSEEISFIPERPGEMRETLASNSKIKSALGWEPSVDLEAYIKSLA